MLRVGVVVLLLCAAPATERVVLADGQGVDVAAVEPSQFNGDTDPLPNGVIARLGATRYRPTQAAKAVAFSPRSHMLSVLTNRGVLERWDADTGELERSLPVIDILKEPIRYAVPSTDGRYFAVRGTTRGDGQPQNHWLSLIEADTGRQRLRLSLEDADGKCVAVSPDGRNVAVDAVAHGERRLSVFDIATEADVAHCELPPRDCNVITFSPDGASIALGTWGGGAHLWKWQSDKEVKELKVSNRPKARKLIKSLAFSPDGTMLAVAGDVCAAGPGISLVRFADSPAILDLAVDGLKMFTPTSIAFSGNGNLLAAAFGGAGAGIDIAVWDIGASKMLHRFPLPVQDAELVAFSHDGERLAAVDELRPYMAVWDIPTGKRLGGEPLGHVFHPSQLKFSPDDRLLITAADDASIRVWDVATAHELRHMKHATGQEGGAHLIRALDVSPDGRWIASASLDGVVCVWELATGHVLWRHTAHGRGQSRAVRFSKDGNILLSAGDDRKLFRWDVATGKLLTEFRPKPTGGKGPEKQAVPAVEGPRTLATVISADATRLFLPLGQMTEVFDTYTGAELTVFPHVTAFIPPIAFSPDNNLALTQSDFKEEAAEHPIRLTATADGKIVREAGLPGRYGFAMTFSKDGRFAAVGSSEPEPEVRILSVPELNEINRLTGFQGEPLSVEFSHSGKLLAISCANGNVLVWKFEKP